MCKGVWSKKAKGVWLARKVKGCHQEVWLAYLCIFSSFRLLFWSDWGEHARIERANMDGSGRTAVVTTELVHPNGLALDFDEGRLYWCDGYNDVIEYANFDGR